MLSGEQPATRPELFETLRTSLTALATRSPVVLVVEDLHWSDRATRDVLEFLVHEADHGRWGLVTSHRHERPLTESELVAFADVLERRPLRRVPLTPLNPAARPSRGPGELVVDGKRLPQPEADLHGAAVVAARNADFERPPQYLHGLFASATHLGGLAPQLQVVHTELTFGVGVGELGAGLRPARRSIQLSCMDQPIRGVRLHLASISQPAAVG